MRVRLILRNAHEEPEILEKEYPLARDEEEARSMMFRDNSKTIMNIIWKGGWVRYNIEQM